MDISESRDIVMGDGLVGYETDDDLSMVKDDS